ncbi:hypothetical protein [Azospirillum endophyticum]
MLQLENGFSQGTLMTRHNNKLFSKTVQGGMCFRLSFKWAACRIKGAIFKNYDLNVVKSHQKHSQYRVKSKAVESTADFSQAGVFDQYVMNDIQEAMNYIKEWGMKFTARNGGTKTVYNNAVGINKVSMKPVDIYLLQEDSTPLDQHSFIYGFYGQRGVNPAGHATAFCRGRYFDPNYGEYSFSTNTHAQVGNDILAHVNLQYSWARHHFVFVLDDSGGIQTAKPGFLKKLFG